MTRPAGSAVPKIEGAVDPVVGRRITLIIGTVWLVFLAFPIIAILTGEHPVWLKVLGLALIVAFGAVYAVGYAVGNISAFETGSAWTRFEPRVVVSLSLMAVLALGVAAIIGMDALGLTSFLIAASMFTLPIAASWTVAVTVLAVTVLVPWLGGAMGEWAFMAVINAAIVVGTGISRFYAERAEAEIEVGRQHAVVTERERVARDVHDVLGHSLTVIALKTELAERLIDADPARARAELREVNSLAREAIADVRATVAGLRVRQVAEELAHARATLADAGVEVAVEGEPDAVDPRHRIVLAWALREATTNILRHSGASRAAIALGPGTLTVEDDGGGFAGSSSGHGLTGLRERIEDAGGTLELGVSARLGGARLEVAL